MSSSPPSLCPICGRPAADAFRPFCSGRCVHVDLARWLNGAYAIPDEEAPAPDDRSADDDAGV